MVVQVYRLNPHLSSIAAQLLPPNISSKQSKLWTRNWTILLPFKAKQSYWNSFMWVLPFAFTYLCYFYCHFMCSFPLFLNSIWALKWYFKVSLLKRFKIIKKSKTYFPWKTAHSNINIWTRQQLKIKSLFKVKQLHFSQPFFTTTRKTVCGRECAVLTFI